MLEVFTQFVGDGAPVQITLHEARGRRLAGLAGTLHGNRLSIAVVLPEAARDLVWAEVVLPAHGLTACAAPLVLTAPLAVQQARWSAESARRGDALTLTADAPGAPDGAAAHVTIFAHDPDGAHEVVAQLVVPVQHERVEAPWTYHYPWETHALPHEADAPTRYTVPAYFFRVTLHGRTCTSALLSFQDWIDITVHQDDGEPLPDHPYHLHLADGTRRHGHLDADGHLHEADVPPGPVRLELLDEDLRRAA